MNKVLKLVFISILVSGCFPDSLTKWDEETTPASSTSSSGGTSDTDSVSTSCSNALCVTVSSTYATGGTSTTHQTCTADTGSQTCTASISEGQLYYSKLKFTIETSGTCSVFAFFPYYYQMSSNAAFTDLTNTAAIDCSTSPAAASCYYGPATTITNFPSATGNYTDTGNSKSMSFEYDSAQSKQLAHTNTACEVENRWVTNNKADKTAAVAAGSECNGYIANTMRDYIAICYDEFDEETTRITVTITDTDGATDTREDW